MKTLRSMFLTLLVVVLVACQTAIPWSTYTSKKGNFSILMPETPVEKSETYDMGPVLQQIGLFTYIAESNFGTFVVHYADFPEDIVKQMNPYDLLDSATLGVSAVFEEKAEAYVASRTKINWQNKYPGRELKVQTTDQSESGVIRVYLVKARMFIVGGAMPNASYSDTEMQRFLDSFTLLRP